MSGVSKQGPCGGNGGTPVSTPMDANTKLLSVKVWARPDCLASIQVKYELDGQTSTSPVWGYSLATSPEFNEVVFNVEQGEFLRSISGTVGKSKEGIILVKSISFITNVTTYGPFGNVKDTTVCPDVVSESTHKVSTGSDWGHRGGHHDSHGGHHDFHGGHHGNVKDTPKASDEGHDHISQELPFYLSAGDEGKIVGFFGQSGALVDAFGVLVFEKPPNPMPPNPKPPQVILSQGPCGGCGGIGFIMDTDANTNLLGLKIWYKEYEYIVAIQLNYELVKGESQWSDIWGNTEHEGAILSEVTFDEGRSLKSIGGYIGETDYGFLVVGLMFLMDDDGTYGPYGASEGAPFILTAGDQGKIIGFNGRSGECLDAIGVIMKLG